MRRRFALIAGLMVALSLSCKTGKKNYPPCDSTGCCEVRRQTVQDECEAQHEDEGTAEVHSCGREGLRAYEDCLDEVDQRAR